MSQTPFSTSPLTLDREEFVARFGGVYEHSPWIVERAYDQGLPDTVVSAEGLSEVLAGQVTDAEETKQLDLLRAHPDLAGKLAVVGELTDASRSEQAGAGLDQCTAEEFDAFQTLNERYLKSFGFPFILAVKGYHRTDILDVFKKRVEHAPDVEFQEALKQVHRIALLRLQALAQSGV